MVSCNDASFSALRIKGLSSPDGSRSQKDVMNNQVSISTANIRGAFGDSLSQVCIPPYGLVCTIFKKQSLVSVKMYWVPWILVLGVGSCLSMAIAGKLVENFGCKRVVLLASFIGMVSLAIVTILPTIATTTVALFFFWYWCRLSGASANFTSYLDRKGE